MICPAISVDQLFAADAPTDVEEEISSVTSDEEPIFILQLRCIQYVAYP